MSSTANTVRSEMPASPPTSDRDRIASQYIEAKRREEKAKADRLAAEEKLCELFGVKPEGSQTVSTDFFKVTTTGNMTRSIDADRFAEIAKTIPKAIRDRVIRTKVEPNLTELRKLEESNPDVYRALAAALTVKPAKASVKVEIIA
jgi:DNA-binding TFAR19-related protein (PDSD5 family)